MPIRSVSRWLAIAALLTATFSIQYPLILNNDLAWLLTACEKILDGSRYGVDVFESNPPIALLMYMPAVIAGRLTGLTPELFVLILVLFEILVAILLIEVIETKADSSEQERRTTTITLLLLLAVLPGKIFGQREHIAVVALTPYVVTASLRWRGALIGKYALLAGIGAGFALCIKPYFIFIIGIPVLARAILGYSIKPLLVPEFIVAVLICIIQALLVLYLFPSYVYNYAPMLAVAYVPIRIDWQYLLIVPCAVSVMSGGLLLLLSRRDCKVWSRAFPWLAAAAGGAGSYFVQGKGYTYTTFALWVFALAAPLLQFRPGNMRASLIAGAAGALALTGLYLLTPSIGFPALEAHVAALVKQPRVLAITDNLGVGNPLVRHLHGSWVGSTCAELLSSAAILRKEEPAISPAERAKLDSVIKFERHLLTADLRSGRPDVVVVDTLQFNRTEFDWFGWAVADPDIRAELQHYREVDDVGRFRIFMRTE